MITLKKSLSAINKGKTTCEDKRIIRIVAMIRLIEELSMMGIHPVIIGDMALAQVLYQSKLPFIKGIGGINSLDMLWPKTDGFPFSHILRATLNDAIKRVNDDYHIEIVRDLTITDTRIPLVFNAVHSEDSVLNFKVNITINGDTRMGKVNSTCLHNVKFACDSLGHQLVKKLTEISTDSSVIKAKDLLDLYQLSMIKDTVLYSSLTYSTVGIRKTLNYGYSDIKPFENFGILLRRKGTLKSAYEQLNVYPLDSKVQKPSFERVYSRVCKFVEPFVSGQYKVDKCGWDFVRGEWYTFGKNTD